MCCKCAYVCVCMPIRLDMTMSRDLTVCVFKMALHTITSVWWRAAVLKPSPQCNKLLLILEPSSVWAVFVLYFPDFGLSACPRQLGPWTVCTVYIVSVYIVYGMDVPPHAAVYEHSVERKRAQKTTALALNNLFVSTWQGPLVEAVSYDAGLSGTKVEVAWRWVNKWFGLEHVC